MGFHYAGRYVEVYKGKQDKRKTREKFLPELERRAYQDYKADKYKVGQEVTWLG